MPASQRRQRALSEALEPWSAADLAMTFVHAYRGELLTLEKRGLSAPGIREPIHI